MARSRAGNRTHDAHASRRLSQTCVLDHSEKEHLVMIMRGRLNFLFVTAHLGGNVSPVMPVVRRLVAAGHRVRVMSDGVNRPDAEAVGAQFRSWKRAPNRTDRAREDDPPDWSVSDKEGIRMVAQFLAGTALAYAEDTIEELKQEPADLLVCFDMLLGPMLGAEAIGQKLALLGTMISFFPLPGIAPLGSGLGVARRAEEQALQSATRLEMTAILDSALPELNAARSQFGLAPLAHLADQCNAASVHWLGTAKAFDFEEAVLRPNMRYAGPLVGDPVWAEPWRSPWRHDDPRPLVLAGFSTSFQNHADVLQRVIDASSSLPIRLVVTLGGSIEPHELTPAENTAVVRSAPHLEILREASLVMTHGGHGTVMAALMHRIPMLVIPHGRDQADNAVRVTERGAGLAVSRMAPTAEIRAALDRLLCEPGFRAAAGMLGDAIDAEFRSNTLIADLEELAGSHGAARANVAARQNETFA
jgi:MGT family glycosyltransferase